MNKWKVAFWICLGVLVVVIGISSYAIIDQSITLTYQNIGYTDTENDLETIIKIFNNADMSKTGIEHELKTHQYYEYMNFSSDTISLSRLSLIFENDTLKTISQQW